MKQDFCWFRRHSLLALGLFLFCLAGGLHSAYVLRTNILISHLFAIALFGLRLHVLTSQSGHCEDLEEGVGAPALHGH